MCMSSENIIIGTQILYFRDIPKTDISVQSIWNHYQRWLEVVEVKVQINATDFKKYEMKIKQVE